MSDGMGREFTYLSSHATNRYFIPNWGNDMSKQVEQMRRMLLILNNIKKRQRISKQELLSRVNDSLYYIYGYKEIGVRTLERDLEDIESMFCVNISYDRSNN